MKTRRSTFKVLFYLKNKAERADGKVPVMIRITVDGEIAQLSAKLFNSNGRYRSLRCGRIKSQTVVPMVFITICHIIANADTISDFQCTVS